MNSTYALALLGGVLIGLASLGLLWMNGRIAGISGIVDGLSAAGTPASERGWRAAFVAGLLVGGLGLLVVAPQTLPLGFEAPLGLALVAGLLVGFGTRMGSGCTSGHGVCGLARLSPRSLVATLTFMATGATTVYLTFHVL